MNNTIISIISIFGAIFIILLLLPVICELFRKKPEPQMISMEEITALLTQDIQNAKKQIGLMLSEFWLNILAENENIQAAIKNSKANIYIRVNEKILENAKNILQKIGLNVSYVNTLEKNVGCIVIDNTVYKYIPPQIVRCEDNNCGAYSLLQWIIYGIEPKH